jgi:hypothetical protein
MNPIEDFNTISQHKFERCGEESKLPTLLKYLPVDSWEKSYIPAFELMNNDNLQMRVGHESAWSYEIWCRTGTTQMNEIARNWDTIKSYLPDNEHIQKHINSIGPELTNLVLYNREKETGIEFPLFLAKDNEVFQLISDAMVDGNHRSFAIFNSIMNGDIQESAPIPIWTTEVPNITMFGYNMLSLLRRRMSLEKKLELMEERILVGKKK